MLGAATAAAHTGQGHATPSNMAAGGHPWGTGDYCTLSPDAVRGVFDFHHACVHHDGCYAGFPKSPGGYPTYWVSRAQCDSWFHGDMVATCHEMHTKFYDPLGPDCYEAAETYYKAVQGAGWYFYKKNVPVPDPLASANGAPLHIYPLQPLPPSGYEPLSPLTPIGPGPGPRPGPSGPTRPETTGGATNTWTNYTNAGGYQGATIASNTTVQIDCKVQGFRVADGNTWWYRIASSPWNGAYYASADAFYNNGQTSGTLHGTPFVDGAVRDC